ncbi:Outer membrane efflux protein [Neorhodopirellula pilleata]|uniref:Outer membrane efflux protein n=2 Tax=Neorhodopirellula pilleata TaxID=2714738 RepID=A0A5C6AV40_9BACT|nr:Outer membrane efflux protein [Neorhodopirellula pilleata]
MWWQVMVAQPLDLGRPVPVDATLLVETSLMSSPYILGLLTEPKIRCNDFVIADAQFDTLSFIDAKFTGTNDPIGSVLTTGDASTRFRDDLFGSAIGLRKQNRTGGNVELVQRGGFQSNNSTFLVPNGQGTSRLELNFSQPLLRDRGRAVNMTRVVLASIDVKLTEAEVRNDIEDHLVDVTRAYWELYQARAEYVQRMRLTQAAIDLHATLKGRVELDSQQRQILRAEVAITRRRSELIRIQTRIANAQSRLRLLTGDAAVVSASGWEWLPQDMPMDQPIDVSTREATLTALDQRPDIASSLREIQAVSTRVGAARNQVLPRLDLILSGYVAGLDGSTNTFGAIGNQFTQGGPSFAGGFVFERPVGNRANEARLQRGKWELTRSIYEFQQTTESAITAVEIAVRETQASYAELNARKQSVAAAAAEVDYLYQRWRWLPDPSESAVLLIEDLLDAQERTADEERAVAASQAAYAMSWIQLRKAMGILLQVHTEVDVPFEPASDVMESIP